MKVILVIDIPDFINSVTKGILKPIGAVGKLEIGYGSDDGEMIRFEFINTDGALLKPMLRREDIYEEMYLAYGLWKEEDYERMRNAVDKVLDEILGDSDD